MNIDPVLPMSLNDSHSLSVTVTLRSPSNVIKHNSHSLTLLLLTFSHIHTDTKYQSLIYSFFKADISHFISPTHPPTLSLLHNLSLSNTLILSYQISLSKHSHIYPPILTLSLALKCPDLKRSN